MIVTLQFSILWNCTILNNQLMSSKLLYCQTFPCQDSVFGKDKRDRFEVHLTNALFKFCDLLCYLNLLDK